MLRLLAFICIATAVLATPSETEWAEDTMLDHPHPVPPAHASMEDHALLDLTASPLVPGAKAGSEDEAVIGLGVQLDAVNPIVDLTETDDDLLLAFTIFNPTAKDAKLCIRDTPLEGVQSNLFTVQCPNGKRMRYRGKDVKRAEQCDPSEIKTIKPGQSVSRKVRLSRRYELNGDGLYYIRVRQPRDKHIIFTDVMRTEVTIWIKGTKEHEERNAAREKDRVDRAIKAGKGGKGGKVPIPASLASVEAISYGGCTSTQKTTLVKWHEDARQKIAASRECSKSNSCKDNIDTWFGTQTTQSQFQAGARSQFNKMADVMDNTIYKCQGGTPDMARTCGGSTFAYVYPTDTTQQIFICDFTFNYPDYSEKVQTVIHELSHFNHIGSTNDNAYGESRCMSLAQQDFTRAIQTADNVGYFGKYVNKCYKNAPSGYIPKNPPRIGCSDKWSNCQQLASNCNGKLGNGALVSTDCCQSCTGGAASNDCTGVSGGSASDSRRRAPDTRRRAPDTRRRAPTTTSSGAVDTAGNCPTLVSSYGCDACCISGSSNPVSSVCAKTCAGGSSGGSTSTKDDTCKYAKDGECDEPTYCKTGTDSTDCGRL